MKILWFSNCKLSDKENRLSGSWLYSMSQLLINQADIQLVNICVNRSSTNKDTVKRIKCSDSFEEYILPNWKQQKDGLPKVQHQNEIKNICENIKPDLIHIWGIENYFCNLLPSFFFSIPLLLEIQGLHAPCADVYYGDLSIRDTLSCLGVREIMFPHLKSIYAGKQKMRQLASKDRDTISKYAYISTQSEWVRTHLGTTSAHLFQTGMSLRKDFWQATQWKYRPTDIPYFYCSAAGPSPYKSIQTAIKALAIIRNKYPQAQLFIIGQFKKSNWLHQAGYLSYLFKLINKLKLRNAIKFTGPLTAREIVTVMQQCVGMIQTSYVESYSLAVAEAQAVGVPSVISFAGAMPELAKDRESGLFFSPGDYISCAAHMIELIENERLATSISKNGYSIAHQRNNDNVVLTTQICIYKDILSTTNKK